MPDNKFKVSELWDGVKKSTSDAWNEATQGMANLLKQIQELATKHLPMIAIVLRIVTTIPLLLDNVKNLLKDLGSLMGTTQKLIQDFIKGLINNLQSFVKTSLRTAEIAIRSAIRLVERSISREFSKLPKTVQNIVKTTLKAIIDPIKGTLKTANSQIQKLITKFAEIKSLFRTELKRLSGEFQKLLGKQTDGILKQVRPIINGVVKSVGDKVNSLLKPLKDVLSSIQREIKLVVSQVTREMDNKIKGLLKGVETSFKALPQAVEKGTKTVTSSIDNTIKGVKDALKATEKRLDDLIEKGTKAATSKVDEVGKVANKTATQLQEMPKKVVAEVVEEVPKRLKPVLQSVENAVKAPIVVVQRAVDDVGKNLGKVAGKVDDVAKQIPKMSGFLDDSIRVLGSVLKTVTAMVPIIEGIAEQIQFEEIFQRLERIERRVDDNIWADLLANRVRMLTLDKKLDRLLGAPGSSTDLQPIILKLDRIIAATGTPKSGTDNAALAAQLQALRSDIGAIPGKIPTTSPTMIAEAVAAKIPKAQTDNAAIAAAVAAKIPKPMDSAILTKTIQDAIKAAPPGQTVSSEAIAAAVAAKIPKPAEAGAIATAVKEKMGPQFKAIDAKLPDNGIFRVDNTAIANAVSTKLEKEKITVEPSNAAILKAINGIPGITKEQTAIVTKAIRDSKTPDKVELDRLNQVVNLVNTHTTNNTKNIVNSVQNITVRSSPAIVNVPATDLSPIEAKLKDISNAIGVDSLKAATPVNAEAMVKQAGQQQFSGGAVQGATTLAGLMAAFAAPQFFRSGSHRLGGTFDKSVMDPKSGKVKIDDAMAFQKWQFDQMDERMGMPTQMQLKDASGRIQPHTYRSMQDTMEEVSATTVSTSQDIEVVERYIVGLTQDIQKLMQICLQTRGDVDVLIDDSGCKVKEERLKHPTHIKLTAPGIASSLANIFQGGEVHYVARKWDDTADKNQKLERISYDTQIAAMSNKFEFDKAAPELPLQKSRATDKPANDQLWRTYVSTMEEPPEGYISKGNPIPDIKEIKNGNPTDVPKPTNPAKKLGK
jgi:hypothetical protein